ncbi:MAG: VOC family protein [Blastocatellia bacterium]|nr:VOC family protein [Blastocatellia bacterium]
MTPNLKQSVPFFGVTNIEASVRFYVKGLGFAMTKQWTPEGKLRWCWLEREGVALMLQEYLPAHLPTEKLGVGVSICFICEDAIELSREFKARGLEASRPFVGNGMWVTSLTDPDGYRLDFESYTDAEEESEYEEE